MPFIWGKKTSLFDQVNFDTMFYPQEMHLSRREKLSVIWLASNYDPEKYKKIISSRDCEGANIVQICSAIANPQHPHALRLSAQLLLGTVRVYRTKANLILQLAESMMLKLSSMLNKVSLRQEVNVIGVARAETITMADGYMSIIDYSLEPIYYDPQMIMHMNEDDMFIVNSNSPYSSPIKIRERKEPSTPKKSGQSPLVVSNRQISITEDLLSPRRLIQIPGEEEFGANSFGPAQDNFIEQLEEGHVGLEGLRDDILPPVFEEDEGLEDPEQTRYPREEVDKKRRRLINDILIDDLGELSQDRIEPVDLDKVLKDAISINFPTVDKTTDDEQRDHNLPSIEESQIDQQMNEEEELVIHRPGNERYTVDRSGIEKTVIGEQVDWEQQLFTPADAIVLKPTPSHPKKKRKLQVDKNTTLSGQDIRNNLGNPASLITTPISAGTVLPGAKELFERPILVDMGRNPRLRKWWDNNCSIEGSSKNKKKRLAIDRPTSSEEEQLFFGLPKSPELQRDLDVTPSSIDIPRAGNASLRSLEQSSGSTLLINQTPIDDALSSRSLDVMFEVDENLGDFPVRSSPRLSGIDILPDIIEADLNDSHGPILDPIPEMEAQDETLVNQMAFEGVGEEEEVFGEELQQSFFTIGDDDEHLPKHLSKYKRHITASTAQTDSVENSVSFFQLFPHTSTKRRDATLAFYTCLNLTKNGLVDLEQNEIFGDIRLWKKHS